MKIQFTNSHRKFGNLFSALFLGAILCTVLATLDWLHLLPFALVGVILPLIPQTRHCKVQYVLWGILAVWLLLRFPSIVDGGKLLANRMFELSQQTQSYEYDYFTVSGGSAVEAVLWLSVLAGTLCAHWGNKVSALLCAAWLLAMAYFGVTPASVWLVVLLAAGLTAAIPGQQRWFYALVVSAVAIGIALSVTRIAPEPNETVSALDDHLRDVLAGAPITQEQTPIPTEVPEPEIVPQPDTELKQPDHGVQKAARNILIFILSAAALALLFVPAVLKDRAEKKRKKAREDFDSPDHAASIRAMYLYAQRWRSLSNVPAEIPAEVYILWQEAAYSDHAMNEIQRKTVHAYMKETAQKVWAEADWKKRLEIQYRVCL